jgi:pyruvate dehydrogenase phosphatase
MSSHTLHEIKTCIEIALRCVESDGVKRPTIAEIVDELNKIDNAKRSFADEVFVSNNGVTRG